ncbi:MAG: hypothetical protein K0Q64_523 [Nitrobacter vulgaris]|nr:hypothetical protein [Nitrobacter vulgaris]
MLGIARVCRNIAIIVIPIAASLSFAGMAEAGSDGRPPRIGSYQHPHSNHYQDHRGDHYQDHRSQQGDHNFGGAASSDADQVHHSILWPQLHAARCAALSRPPRWTLSGPPQRSGRWASTPPSRSRLSKSIYAGQYGNAATRPHCLVERNGDTTTGAYRLVRWSPTSRSHREWIGTRVVGPALDPETALNPNPARAGNEATPRTDAFARRAWP